MSVGISLMALAVVVLEVQSAGRAGAGRCHPSFSRLDSVTLSHPPKLRNRPGMPHSHLVWLPETLNRTRRDFPALFRYDSEPEIAQASEALRQLVDDELTQFGAIVVRGLPLHTPQDFSAAMHATGLFLVDYIGGVTSRPTVAPKVTPTSTESSCISMEPHVDNSYWAQPPTHLIFYAHSPPSSGGHTLLTDTRKVLQQLQSEQAGLLEALRSRRVRYVHFYPDEHSDVEAAPGLPSWQQAFAPNCTGLCNPRDVAEENLRIGGFKDYEWGKDGLRRWELVDAVNAHPVTGEATWANQIGVMHCSVFDNHPEYRMLNRVEAQRSEACEMRGPMPYHSTFGDAGEFPVWLMDGIRRAQWDHSVAFDYAAGDVLIIDNYLAMHGRFSWDQNDTRLMYMAMVVQR